MTIMNDKTREFVAMHRDEDVRELALKAKRVDGLDLPLALDQIAGWQIASKKLPHWASCEGIVYPPHISMEQCSSQFTAQSYHPQPCTPECPILPNRTCKRQKVRSTCPILPNRTLKRLKRAYGCPILENRTHWWRRGLWWI